MSKTTKTIGVITSIAAVGLLGAYAFAQQGPGAGHGRMGMGPGMMKGMGHGGMGHRPMMGQMGDPAGRLSDLKTELGIKAEQASAWDAYAKVVTTTATERREHVQNIDRDAVRDMQPADRQKHFSAMQTQREAAQAKVKAAAEALLATLDEPQKAKARETLPGLAAAGSGRRFGMMGGAGGCHGMGPRRSH